jgi:Rieske Fe-S protein
MRVHDRRWLLHKFLHLGTGLVGLTLLGGCIYEKAEPVCVDGPSAKLLPANLEQAIIYGGDEYLIRWVAFCVDFVRIEFSRNKGIDWIILGEKIPAKEGEFFWQVPQIYSELAFFRLIDVATNQVLSMTETAQRIIPKVTVLLKNHPELETVGGLLLIELPSFGTVSIIRTGASTFKVLNLNCTHLGCPLNTDDQGQNWYCNCHGSLFSKLGCVVNGPAQRPLPVYEHQFNNGEKVLIIYNIQNEPTTC